MAINISNEPIEDSFESLLLVSSSGGDNIIQDAVGNVYNSFTMTASYATTASIADTAINAGFATTAGSATIATSASFAQNSQNAAIAVSSSFSTNAVNAVSASYALFAVSASVEITKELSSSYADVAGIAQSIAGADVVGTVTSASYALVATSASFATSASHALNADNAVSSSYALNATTASYVLNADSASLAIRNLLTASNDFSDITFTKGDGSTFLIDTTPRQVIEGVKNVDTITLGKGSPVYVSGSTGNLANVYRADAGNASRMPATFVLEQTLDPLEEGLGILNGFINNVSTIGFEDGDEIWVAVGGGYTNVRPTGSAQVQKLGNVIKGQSVNGSGVITGAGRSNDLPNITSGYAWVGNENQVATAVSTASFSVATASVALTAIDASLAESVEIGVQDQNFNYRVIFGVQGSSEKLYVDNVGNFNYNPSINRLFNINSVESNNFTGSLLGNIVGNLTGTADSASNALRAISASIADDIKDGINVSFNSGSFNDIVATTLSVTNFTAVTSSVVITGDAFIQLNNDTPTQRYAGMNVVDSGSNTTASFQFDGLNNDWFYEYENGDGTNFGAVIFGPEYGTKGNPIYPSANTLLKGDGGHHMLDSSITDDGSLVTVNNPLTVTGQISGNVTGDLTGNADTATSASYATNAGTATSASFAQNSAVAVSASFAESASVADSSPNLVSSVVGGFASNQIDVTKDGFTSTVTINGVVNAISSSFAENSAIAVSASFATSASVADLATLATTATTASFASSIASTLTQNLTISGSVNGSVTALSIVSDTASLDMSVGNFFTLAMPAGGAVHITATNKQAGQTINLQTTQNATSASFDFNSEFKFESGSIFTASTGSGIVDLMSFVTFDTSNVLGTGINNLL